MYPLLLYFDKGVHLIGKLPKAQEAQTNEEDDFGFCRFYHAFSIVGLGRMSAWCELQSANCS
jgi:hypothetical protein